MLSGYGRKCRNASHARAPRPRANKVITSQQNLDLIKQCSGHSRRANGRWSSQQEVTLGFTGVFLPAPCSTSYALNRAPLSSSCSTLCHFACSASSHVVHRAATASIDQSQQLYTYNAFILNTRLAYLWFRQTRQGTENQQQWWTQRKASLSRCWANTITVSEKGGTRPSSAGALFTH